jgi:hypothetical protein
MVESYPKILQVSTFRLNVCSVALGSCAESPKIAKKAGRKQLRNREIVHVHAASLKPIDKQLASGSHYASSREFPLVCGSDGDHALRSPLRRAGAQDGAATHTPAESAIDQPSWNRTVKQARLFCINRHQWRGFP